jgi:Zn finger protein HypA/HybF involved in hydrogenase expression
MEVIGHCRECNGGEFDAHWDQLPKGSNFNEVVPCPNCGSKNIWIETDEHYSYDDPDYPPEPYDNEEDSEEESND